MKKVIAIALSVAAFASVSLAFAEELAVKPESDRETSGSKRTELAQEFKAKVGEWKTERQQALEKLKQEKEKLRSEFKAKFTADKCAKIKERIQNQTAKLGSAKIKHMSVYVNLQNRIQKFIDRFEAFYAANPGKGDATKLAKLKTDLGLSTDLATANPATLNSLINAFQASLTDFSAKLASTKNVTCTSAEGEVRGSLADAKVYLQTVHTNAAAIRTYVRGTILPDLLAVKQDIAKIKGTAGGENSTGDQTGDNQGDENDGSDTTLPTVSITAPTDNATYTAAATVAIEASAADNVKVEKVEFYDGGILKGTDKEAPYSYDWSFTNADNSIHSWTAKAYDDADNSATSALVSVTVAIP